ncbi:MAG: alkaline phosphatase family protein, partial [Acidobacteria bacterium]|nr:alkaline phosphatase family protein [Acidobacteriota bacterium]
MLGIDGMDPGLLARYIQEGKLPHFARLAEQGGLRTLTTTIPPQSPVAWSSLITGANPGEHGIFDFIHRDPKTLLPYFSTSQVHPPERVLRLGGWVLPLQSGRTELLRQGTAFWTYLDRHKVPVVLFHMPANFPPVESKGRTFAGMGTPDLLGTYGTFSLYTDDAALAARDIAGGRVYRVAVAGNRVQTRLAGPPNPFREGGTAAEIDLTLWIDPVRPVAKVAVQGEEMLLQEGEWSDWVPLEFPLLSPLQSVSGICRFFLKQVRPRLQLYVTPINLDPARPSLPLSTPEGYARQLQREAGYFYTQGIAEDTKALSAGVFNDGEYLQQARLVLEDQLRIFDLELERFDAGFLFFYFSGVDQNSHMFWRAIDPDSPAYTAEINRQYGGVLEQFYEEMDQVVGQAMSALDADTTLLVLSDHGFGPYRRSFNLNTWLLHNGYIILKEGAAPKGSDIFSAVDWSRTRAYSLGLN